MVNADGGSVEFLAANYQGRFSLGYFQDRFGLGGSLRSEYRDYTVTVGDESVPFILPTDFFNSSQYFMARGLGLTRTTEQSSIFFMAGLTSVGLGTGFFQIAQSEQRVAVLFLEQKLRYNLRLFSRNIVSGRQTSLQGLRWDAAKWVSASMTAGTGSNQPYAAVGADLHAANFAVKASYVDAGSDFRRITVSSPLFSEVNHENIEVAYQPFHAFGIMAGHHNVLDELTPKGPFSAASVNSVTASFNIARVYFGAGVFNSGYSGRTTAGTNLYAGRAIASRFEVTGNYFQSRFEGVSLTTLSGTMREMFSRRFSLLQVVSHSNDETTLAYGGEFLANRFKVNADYQNVYLPFRPNRPFEQALSVNASLRVIAHYS